MSDKPSVWPGGGALDPRSRDRGFEPHLWRTFGTIARLSGRCAEFPRGQSPRQDDRATRPAAQPRAVTSGNERFAGLGAGIWSPQISRASQISRIPISMAYRHGAGLRDARDATGTRVGLVDAVYQHADEGSEWIPVTDRAIGFPARPWMGALGGRGTRRRESNCGRVRGAFSGVRRQGI